LLAPNSQEGKPPCRTPLEQELQAVHSTGMTLAVFLRFIDLSSSILLRLRRWPKRSNVKRFKLSSWKGALPMISNQTV